MPSPADTIASLRALLASLPGLHFSQHSLPIADAGDFDCCDRLSTESAIIGESYAEDDNVVEQMQAIVALVNAAPALLDVADAARTLLSKCRWIEDEQDGYTTCYVVECEPLDVDPLLQALARLTETPKETDQC